MENGKTWPKDFLVHQIAKKKKKDTIVKRTKRNWRVKQEVDVLTN